MFASRSEYDRGVNTFSPEGRIFQIEYAVESIKHGTTAVGIQTFEGVVIGAERRTGSPLLIPESMQRISIIDEHIGCAVSGFTADARTLIEHARVEGQNHRFNFNEPMRVEACTLSVSDLSMGFGEGGKQRMSRPFGVSLLVAGIDDKGPLLYHTDPSGTYTRYDAKAIGAGSEGAQTILQEKYFSAMTLEEAKSLTLNILKQVMEEKLTSTNVEVGIIETKDKKFRMLSQQELEAIMAKL
eukprot:NODE_1200_length_958_cov_88.600481_g1155_i0.p1 GENE.NODE_1200_length_958_cov_88.600481_g1155_i0~~NODE_1200_length_958_cov_88.600481_g1155_i0.p1  ORF type:complete len:241 (+),score=20.25 NODE_1200_length_958_cov_88.600481_g1155_i0:64-786(+)